MSHRFFISYVEHLPAFSKLRNRWAIIVCYADITSRRSFGPLLALSIVAGLSFEDLVSTTSTVSKTFERTSQPVVLGRVTSSSSLFFFKHALVVVLSKTDTSSSLVKFEVFAMGMIGVLFSVRLRSEPETRLYNVSWL